MKIIITSGFFNPLHAGHLHLLQEARTWGDRLIVIVNTDAQVALKGSVPFMDEQERMKIIESLRSVDEVMLSVDTDKSVAESLRKIAQEHPGDQLFFAKGGDRNVGNLPENERRVCEEFSITIINNVGGGKSQSSSSLLDTVHVKTKIKNLQSVMVAGNAITMAAIPDIMEMMDFWIEKEPSKAHWIVATGMHGIVEAHKNSDLKAMLAQADLWIPDGISLAWLGRMKGFPMQQRTAGPDLFHAFLQHSQGKGYKHFFYGDTKETLEVLQKKIFHELPSVHHESYSPPFRALTPQENEEIIKKINAARPDVLWVGLGMPKQEQWIFNNKKAMQVPVIIGVGAAFKFEAKLVSRAPRWIGNLGFEWLWRLVHEPKAVWQRVFIDLPQFLWLVATDLFTKKNP